MRLRPDCALVCVELGSICIWPSALVELCESSDNQNVLPTGSMALRSVLMKGSLLSLGICLSHRTLLCPAGREPGDECGRDNEAPMAAAGLLITMLMCGVPTECWLEDSTSLIGNIKDCSWPSLNWEDLCLSL